jgi:hypothetical protein
VLNLTWKCGLNFAGWGCPLTSFCEYGSELSSSVKAGNFLTSRSTTNLSFHCDWRHFFVLQGRVLRSNFPIRHLVHPVGHRIATRGFLDRDPVFHYSNVGETARHSGRNKNLCNTARFVTSPHDRPSQHLFVQWETCLFVTVYLLRYSASV